MDEAGRGENDTASYAMLGTSTMSRVGVMLRSAIFSETHFCADLTIGTRSFDGAGLRRRPVGGRAFRNPVDEVGDELRDVVNARGHLLSPVRSGGLRAPRLLVLDDPFDLQLRHPLELVAAENACDRAVDDALLDVVNLEGVGGIVGAVT